MQLSSTAAVISACLPRSLVIAFCIITPRSLLLLLLVVMMMPIDLVSLYGLVSSVKPAR